MKCTTDQLLAWITAGSFLTSIILTSIAIYVSCHIDRQNKQLQKDIHNREVKLQYRNDILSIYNTFMESLTILQRRGTVASIFAHEQTASSWSHELYDNVLKLHNAYNRANLIFDNIDFINYLMNICNSYSDIARNVAEYIYSGAHIPVIQHARDSIATQFGIHPTDYYSMSVNFAAREYFIKLCENNVTKQIELKIQTYSNLLYSDEFNNKFKTYIVISEIPNSTSEASVIARIGSTVRSALNCVVCFFRAKKR